MKRRTRIGGGFFRPVFLGEDEVILKESFALYARSVFFRLSGLLYLTNRRIVWTPFVIPLGYKPVLIDRSPSLKAVGPSSIWDKLTGYIWRVATPGERHAFMLYWSPTPKRTRQWVDAINEWASS